MAISNLTPVDPWPSRKLPQDRFDASVKTAMDQMSVMVGELNSSFIPAANETAEAINTLNPDLPAIRDAPNQAAAAAASAEAAAGSAGAAAESVSAAAQEVEKAKGEVVNAQAEVERAKAEADRAKAEADRAEFIAGVGPATAEKLGLVKPDGTTTQTTDDGTLSVPTFEGSSAGLVPAATSADAKKVLLGDGTWGIVEDDVAALTISEDLILTADSPRTLVLKASVSDLSVRLPDPATLTKETTFHIIVRPLNDIKLCDFSGQVIKAYPVLSMYTAIRVQLVDPLTGLWVLSKYESGSPSDAKSELLGLNVGDLIIFSSVSTSYISVTALSESKALVCYYASSTGKACVLSISGTTVTVGAEKVFSSVSTGYISVTALSESKALVCYSASSTGKACVLSISGTTVTVGAEKVFSSESTVDISVTALSESKALVCYYASSTGEARVLSISGTTVTVGAKNVFSSVNTDYISVTALSESKALMCYYASSTGKARVLSISGTTVTVGAENVFSSVSTFYISVTALSESKALVCDVYSTEIKARVLSISGTTVTVVAENVFNSKSADSISVTALSESKALLCYNYNDSSNNAYEVKACVLSISGTTVTAAYEKVLNSYETDYISVTALPFSDGKTIVSFSDRKNGAVGKYCLLYFA